MGEIKDFDFGDVATTTPLNDELSTINIPSVEPKTTETGLSNEEENDPNKIVVTITDSQTPIVVLFGPPQCGKTMAVVRLTRYLRQTSGLIVSPVKTFRPAFDSHYKQMCESFNDLVSDNNAANSTSRINFMLLKISKQGTPQCQLLEAPGEHYYNPNETISQNIFPTYVNTIIHSNTRKIWVIFVEPNWLNEKDRLGYVEKIKSLKKGMKAQDKVLFVFNKIDDTEFVISPGQVNMKAARGDVKNNYPGIFEMFKNQNPITSLFKEYNCDFISFSTGTFTEAGDGTKMFQQGDDVYPRNLWNKIMNLVRG